MAHLTSAEMDSRLRGNDGVLGNGGVLRDDGISGNDCVLGNGDVPRNDVASIA